MHLLFTQVQFLFWQLGRGKYVIFDAVTHKKEKNRGKTTEKMTDTEGKVKIGTENAEAPFDHGAIYIKFDLVENEKSSAGIKCTRNHHSCVIT